MKKQFSERLTEALRAKKMTAAELSRLSGVDKGSISRYLKGERNNPTTERIDALARALFVSPAWLMGYDVEMNDNDRLIAAYERADEKTKKIVRQLPDMEG